MRAPITFTPKYTSVSVENRTPPSANGLKIAEGDGLGRDAFWWSTYKSSSPGRYDLGATDVPQDAQGARPETYSDSIVL